MENNPVSFPILLVVKPVYLIQVVREGVLTNSNELG